MCRFRPVLIVLGCLLLGGCKFSGQRQQLFEAFSQQEALETGSALTLKIGASSDSFGGSEDMPLSGTALAIHPEGAALIFQVATAPQRGTFTFLNNGTGAFTYIPNVNFNGTDTVRFYATDGRNASSIAMLTFSILPMPDAPIAVNDSYKTAKNQPLTFDPKINDSDPDMDVLTISTVFMATKGEARLENSGLVSYTPNLNEVGNDSFNYTVSDGTGGSSTATISFMISDAPVMQPPVATNDTATTAEETAVTINVLANDSDPDGDIISIKFVSMPFNGTAAIIAGMVRYTPNLNYDGTDTFNYTLEDSTGRIASGLVAVTITAVNDAPRLVTNQGLSTVQGTVKTITQAALNTIDVDDVASAIQYEIIQAPVVGTLKRNGVTLMAASVFTQQDINQNLLTYTQNGSSALTDSFRFSVRDDGLAVGASAQMFSITITSAAARVTYVQVQDVFNRNFCYTCHGEGQMQGGVDLGSYSAVLDYVGSTNPANTVLYPALDSGAMPKNLPRLSVQDLGTISNWIMGGAPEN